MCPYSLSGDSFSIKIDMTVYPRSAVMKAMYRFHDEYIIAFERESSYLIIEAKSRSGLSVTPDVVADFFKELSFQTIRYDTMKQTKGVRELLVARALYATCIENDENQGARSDNEASDWRKDKDDIFSSWSS